MRTQGRRQIRLVIAVVIALNLVGWGLYAYSASAGSATAAYVGAGTLAYVLGVRHAFDADHLATIDDCTRLLVRQGQRPAGLGLFFALGHSSVVFVLFVVVAVASASASDTVIPAVRGIGGTFSALVAACFLLFVGILNLRVLRRVWTARQAHRGVDLSNEQIDEILNARSVLSRLFGSRLQSSVTASWRMFPIGFVFGLGLETASEIALLGLSATAAVSGTMPLMSLLALPILFAAGMTLFDTLNSLLMVSVYGSNRTQPRRRLTFNMVMTLLTACIAIAVGLIYAAGLLVSQFGIAFLTPLAEVSQHFELVGYVIVVAYGTVWAWMLIVSRGVRSADSTRAAKATSAARTPAARSNPDV
jgi:nickel/cobalt transporter (NiCoT) family protein